MNESVISRPANEIERATLAAALTELRHSRADRLSMLVGPTFTLLILLGLLWLILRWVASRFSATELGLHSPAMPWILGAGALLLVLVMGPEVLRIFRRTKSAVSALEADLASGTVEDMTIRVVQAIRLQEPEHGGFLYFLLATDERIYVQFDYESQDIGVQGQDPEGSAYLPRDTLNVVRAQKSDRVLTSVFTGQPVPIVTKGKLTSKPKHWPEPDSFCETPWNSLVSTYSA